MNKPGMVENQQKHFGAILAVIIALFLGRIAQWCLSEFWYDETLSLLLFVLKPQSLGEVFRSYQIANNHILSNAIEWIWLQLGGGGTSFAEEMVRVPAIAAAAGTLLVMGLSWRRLMGERCALYAAAVMAASPVFCGFAWQMRGYSLAIFLATLAVTAGAMRIIKPTARNAAMLFASSMLLPLVMPSAAMLPCAVAMAMACGTFATAKEGSRRCIIWPAIRAGILPFAGAILGVAYYLTLWKNFVYASHEAGGWEGFWRTLGAIVGPFLLHGIVPLAVAATVWCRGRRRFALSAGGGTSPGGTAADDRLCRRLDAAKTSSDGTSAGGTATDERLCRVMRRYGCWLAVSAVVAIVAVLALRIPEGRYPFPRVFVPLLPAITFGLAMLPCRRNESVKAFLVQLALVLVVGFGAGWLGDRWNDVSLRAGVTRQNLLCQYYRGKDDNRQLAGAVYDSLCKEGRSVLLIVPGIDGPTIQFYLSAMAGNQPMPWYLATGVEHYDVAMLQQARQYKADVMISARNEAEARRMLSECKLDESMPWEEWQLSITTGCRMVWKHHLY